MEVISALRGGLIVSCQVPDDSPLHGALYTMTMARAAEKGGARGLRVRSYEDIFAVKQAVSLPIIGLTKTYYPNSDVYITPTFKEAREVYEAGADILSLDCTRRKRPDGIRVEELVRRIKEELNLPILADVSTLEEGLLAEDIGADMVATTLSGYTPYSRQGEGPDFELLRQLISQLKVPVVAEGRISTPEESIRALEMGVFAVVVGSAITNPEWITQRFVESIAARTLKVVYEKED